MYIDVQIREAPQLSAGVFFSYIHIIYRLYFPLVRSDRNIFFPDTGGMGLWGFLIEEGTLFLLPVNTDKRKNSINFLRLSLVAGGIRHGIVIIEPSPKPT